MKTIRYTFILQLLSVYTLLACFATPQSQVTSKEELVDRTKTIVLAQVVKAEMLASGDVKYTFKPERSIKGTPPENFVIEGSVLAEGDIKTFRDHQDEEFWHTAGGRCYHDTDCLIHPAFAVGRMYLIFLEQPYHQQSFEQVDRIGETDTDKWLAWVAERCKAK